MQKNRPVVLSIAGFDPCGGAGVLADAKTFEMLDVQGMAVITANTIQTEDSFSHIDWMDIDVVCRSIRVLMSRYEINIFKIGIVKDVAFLNTIVQCVKTQNENAFIIWDPVIKSSSGFRFLDENNWHLLSSVLDVVNLVTPNYDECQILKPYLENNKSVAVLIKGGHRMDAVGVDVLQIGNSTVRFDPVMQTVCPKHGSGCILSSSIAAHIALGESLENACLQAKRYVETYLNSHSSLLGYHHYAE